jgi:hypothetical protein
MPKTFLEHNIGKIKKHLQSLPIRLFSRDIFNKLTQYYRGEKWISKTTSVYELQNAIVTKLSLQQAAFKKGDDVEFFFFYDLAVEDLEIIFYSSEGYFFACYSFSHKRNNR